MQKGRNGFQHPYLPDENSEIRQWTTRWVKLAQMKASTQPQLGQQAGNPAMNP